MPRRTIPPTRGRLILTAAKLFSRKGFAATGVDELCQAAAARKGSFYHFFPSKTDLAVAAVQYLWEELEASVFEPIDKSSDRGLERLDRLVDAIEARQRSAAGSDRGSGSPIGTLGQEMAHRDPRIREAVQTAFDKQCRYLQDWLDEAKGERQISTGDNLTRARQILAFLEGALLLAKVAGDAHRFKELCSAVPFIAGRFFASGRPAPGTPPELM
jgi:TetR/AcrR family transcriptional repressor of nem operon